MKKRGMMTTLLGAMAFMPSLMNTSKKVTKDMRDIGRKSSKIAMNRMGNKKTTAMIATGIGGYLLAHAAPIRTLIREK